MFRKAIEMHLEDLGSAGNWNTFAYLKKLQDNDVDQTRNDGRLYVWARSTDYTNNDDLKLLVFLEVFGSFHDVVPQ